MKPNTVGQTPAAWPQQGPVTSPVSRILRDSAARCNGGIPSGTIVLTLQGEMPVEYIESGDRIITRNSGAVRLIRRETRRVSVPVVRILAGSLGDTRPESDTMLPAAQAVLLRDWRAKAMFGQPQAVAAAGALVDDEFITDLGLREMVLHHLVFDRDQVVYAGGLELLAPAPEAAVIRAA